MKLKLNHLLDENNDTHFQDRYDANNSK